MEDMGMCMCTSASTRHQHAHLIHTNVTLRNVSHAIVVPGLCGCHASCSTPSYTRIHGAHTCDHQSSHEHVSHLHCYAHTQSMSHHMAACCVCYRMSLQLKHLSHDMSRHEIDLPYPCSLIHRSCGKLRACTVPCDRVCFTTVTIVFLTHTE